MTVHVYIAGPYTKPDPCANTRRAMKVADQLVELGYVPFIPHLSHFWHTLTPRPYTFWLEYDKLWLRKCDVVLRYPGASSGADEEVELADDLGIPVVYSLADLRAECPIHVLPYTRTGVDTTLQVARVAKGLLDFIRENHPADFGPDGRGFTCEHHRALDEAVRALGLEPV